MGTTYEKSKILYSITRYIAGLKPKSRSRYYFEKYSYREKLKQVIPKDTKTCPFCKKIFLNKGSLVKHLLRYHVTEILYIIDKLEEKE
jgi:hypothetical protein